MPVHHLLEQILNEFIVAAGLQSGQPLFQSVNPVRTPGLQFGSGPKLRIFSPPLDVTWGVNGITIYLENDGLLSGINKGAVRADDVSAGMPFPAYPTYSRIHASVRDPAKTFVV